MEFRSMVKVTEDDETLDAFRLFTASRYRNCLNINLPATEHAIVSRTRWRGSEPRRRGPPGRGGVSAFAGVLRAWPADKSNSSTITSFPAVVGKLQERAVGSHDLRVAADHCHPLGGRPSWRTRSR